MFKCSNVYLFSVNDNRALSLAAQQAAQEEIPLLALFVFSPEDYVAHDTASRRIDFTLRNLRILKVSYITSYV